MNPPPFCPECNNNEPCHKKKPPSTAARDGDYEYWQCRSCKLSFTTHRLNGGIGWIPQPK